MNRLEFHYHFFPVGQGLFSFGWLRRWEDRPPSRRLLWVYDCGTSSSPGLVKNAIEALAAWTRQSNHIDLLVLSHFDRDHISGVCDLIRRFRIGTLLLPYMHLARRLMVAFAEDVAAADPLMAFFVNPVAYLTEIEGPGIERIVFVPPSGDEGPPLGEGVPLDEPFLEDGPSPLVFRTDDAVDPERGTLIGASSRANVSFLLPGQAITAKRVWEFVPYNDDVQEKIPGSFVSQVQAFRKHLLATSSDQERNEALGELRAIYDGQFGDSAKDRNAISLFLYSGPMRAGWHHVGLNLKSACRHLPYWSDFCGTETFYELPRNRPQPSLLYTGDGYLDTTNKLKRLLKYLAQERVDLTGLLQVMHHGAESNWHEGVAAAISPLCSVFSSDPAHQKLRHPHATVLRDFWPYGPIRVDKDSGFEFAGILGP